MIYCWRTLAQALFIVALAASVANAQASSIVFVRHAEKAATPGTDPDLSDAGKARSADLAVALAHFHLDAVFVTEFRRTRQTADSTAASQHLMPIVVATKGDPKIYAAAVAAELLKLPAGSTALVVGHSNTIGPVIAALGGPKVSDLCDAEYGTFLLLELSGERAPPRLLRTSYGAPDSPEGIACARRMRLGP